MWRSPGVSWPLTSNGSRPMLHETVNRAIFITYYERQLTLVYLQCFRYLRPCLYPQIGSHPLHQESQAPAFPPWRSVFGHGYSPRSGAWVEQQGCKGLPKVLPLCAWTQQSGSYLVAVMLVPALGDWLKDYLPPCHHAWSPGLTLGMLIIVLSNSRWGWVSSLYSWLLAKGELGKREVSKSSSQLDAERYSSLGSSARDCFSL